MISAIVYAILFSLLAVIIAAPLKARYLAFFCGIVLFPLGISFLKSPTVRPQDLFLYGFLAVSFFKGRKYCEHDFQMLFAPCCGSCGKASTMPGKWRCESRGPCLSIGLRAPVLITFPSSGRGALGPGRARRAPVQELWRGRAQGQQGRLSSR